MLQRLVYLIVYMVRIERAKKEKEQNTCFIFCFPPSVGTNVLLTRTRRCKILMIKNWRGKLHFNQQNTESRFSHVAVLLWLCAESRVSQMEIRKETIQKVLRMLSKKKNHT